MYPPTFNIKYIRETYSITATNVSYDSPTEGAWTVWFTHRLLFIGVAFVDFIMARSDNVLVHKSSEDYETIATSKFGAKKSYDRWKPVRWRTKSKKHILINIIINVLPLYSLAISSVIGNSFVFRVVGIHNVFQPYRPSDNFLDGCSHKSNIVERNSNAQYSSPAWLLDLSRFLDEFRSQSWVGDSPSPREPSHRSAFTSTFTSVPSIFSRYRSVCQCTTGHILGIVHIYEWSTHQVLEVWDEQDWSHRFCVLCWSRFAM